MLKQLAVGTAAVGATAALTLCGLSRAMYRRLPCDSRAAMDGITTIDDAVRACRRSGLEGWELVANAQQLVARKFTYSRLNTWDSPSRAFERGMGYCEQQALSLKRIYDALYIESRPVFALQCRVPAREIDGMPWSCGITGHAWLRVTFEGVERDVCPGALANTPGVVQFEVLSPVHTLYRWLRPWTHLGSSLENIRRDLLAQCALRGQASECIQVAGRSEAPASPAPEAVPARERNIP